MMMRQLIDKLTEIEISPKKELLDNIKEGNIAAEVYDMFNVYKDISDNYSIPARVIFDTNTLADIMDNVDTSHKAVHLLFDPPDQVYHVIDQLYKYFVNDEYEFSG
jgi:hypothetical protein